MSISATTDWHLLSNRYYRKSTLYTPSWSRSLGPFSSLRFATAPASPIAILPSSTHIHTLTSTQSTQQNIKIYTQSGKLLSQFPIQSRLVAFGWVSGERLVCVSEDGGVKLYNLHGEYTQFSMGGVAKEHGIIDCMIWESGILILLKLRCRLHDWKLPVNCCIGSGGASTTTNG
jgi:hypothetical protein